MDARLIAMAWQHQPDDLTPRYLITLLHQRLDRFEGDQKPLRCAKGEHSSSCHLATKAHGGLGRGEQMGPISDEVKPAVARTPGTRGGTKVTQDALRSLGGPVPGCLRYRRQQNEQSHDYPSGEHPDSVTDSLTQVCSRGGVMNSRAGRGRPGQLR